MKACVPVALRANLLEEAHSFRTDGIRMNSDSARCSSTHQFTGSQVDSGPQSRWMRGGFPSLAQKVLPALQPSGQETPTLFLSLRVLQKSRRTMQSSDDSIVGPKTLGSCVPCLEVINRLNDLQQEGIHVSSLDGLIDTKASWDRWHPLVLVRTLLVFQKWKRSLGASRACRKVRGVPTGQTGGNLPQGHSFYVEIHCLNAL